MPNKLQNRGHRRGFCQKCRPRFSAQDAVFSFQPRGLSQRLAQIDLRAQNREQPNVLPWLLDKVARTTPHGLHGHFDAAPRGHDDDRQSAIEHLNPREQVKPLLARRRISRVVQVHQDRVKFPRFDGAQYLRGRGHALGFIPLALQQQAQSIADVRLVVRQ